MRDSKTKRDSRLNARVESSYQLATSDKKTIENKILKMFSDVSGVKFTVNKDVIAGIRIYVGDNIYDDTLIYAISQKDND